MHGECIEEVHSDMDFFVHCCGHYKLSELDDFLTDRQHGTANHQLLYILDGEMCFRVQNELRTVKKGNFVLYTPNQPQYYEYRHNSPADFYWIHFSCAADHPLIKKKELSGGFLHSNVAQSICTELFNGIIQELQLQQACFVEIAANKVQELLLQIVRGTRKTLNTEYCTYFPQVEEAVLYFNAYSEKNFTIKEYTKQRGLNYYRFIDNFTQVTGLAPRQYIIHVRMNKAKALLVNESFTVQQIAQLVGYDNSLYFSRIFKKSVGIAPTEYRNSATRNTSLIK